MSVLKEILTSYQKRSEKLNALKRSSFSRGVNELFAE